MTGELYIDNIDIYSQFGVWITEGGYDGLLSFPDLREPEKNEWAEEDGIEVDLEELFLRAREVTISFVASNPGIDAKEFINFLCQPGYRKFRIPILGREWELRLTKQASNEIYTGLSAFSLTFADDFPPKLESFQANGGGVYIPGSDFEMDGIALERYGIVAESGRDDLLKSPAIRQGLTRNVSTMDGQIYDIDGKIHFKEKDVTFKCCLIADSIERFWQCYEAFFINLVKPNERRLTYSETGLSYKCYYKKTANWKIIQLSGRVVVEFSLTLVFTSFRPGKVEYLLATEDNAFVNTEDEHFVDMSLIRPAINRLRSFPAPASSEPEAEEGNTELRKRKITEMPETGSLDGLYVPAVDGSNRNVRIAATLLKGEKGDIGPGNPGEGGVPFNGNLGDLKNVDKTFDTLTNGKYAFEMRGGRFYPIEVTNIGDGGSALKVTYLSNPVMAISFGGSALLRYTFSSVMDGSPTGPGKAEYTVNGKRVASVSIQQGDNAFDAGKFLILGSNTVKVDVTDSYSSTRSLNFSIEAVSISISSTFDASQVLSGEVTYKYTPVGAIEKTIHFEVDGTEVGTTLTTLTNRQLTYAIPQQQHGSHLLEVYITADIEGSLLTSNRLRYDLICVEAGNATPVIASPFLATTAQQYSTLQIRYVVYDPAHSLANVTLSVNGEVVSILSIDRSQHTWSYRVSQMGNLTLAIASAGVTKQFTLQVTQSSIDAEATTADLELYLTSMGRSNSEVNKATWTYGQVSAALNHFNFSTNGWLPDNEGNVVLRVSGDARVEIPLQIFAKDLRVNGKTVEFEFSTSNVTDYDAIVASCWDNGKGIRITAQKAIFVSTQTSVEVQFKEEERVRISFVVEETAENRLIYTYINGVISGTVQYPVNDSFAQVTPAGISLGSNACTVDIYNIRVYGNNLTPYQILDNHIADMDNMDKKIALFERNQIYDAYGEIVYNRILDQLPCMTLVGDLPNYKGDKKTMSLTYEDRQNPSRSFTAPATQTDVQGTSSQYYPRKNYKIKFKKDITLTESGEKTPVYALRDDSIAVDTFCVKADFAESSGTHNTGLAKLIEYTMKKLGYLTPPQRDDERIRTTVDGFPIVIFHKASADSPALFLGKYNFNNDKSTQGAFGFSGDAECWEFCNNTSKRVLFHESDYVRLDADGKPDWLNDFEARYPDDDDLNAEYEAGKIPEKFKRLTDWIASTNGNTDKFRSECANYFDLNFLLAAYVFTELFAMVDQRAKNMFFATWDGLHWFPIFYDNDTCNGINNEGDIAFNYDVEYHDTIGTQNVYNGESSVLWRNVESCFNAEITALYARIRVDSILSYEKVIDELNTQQSSRWCEAIYNADGHYKYIDPLINGYYDYGTNQYVYTGAYLYALQGSRAEHRKWWLYNRFRYMDSKYNTGNYVSDYATMRLYTPENWTGVAPDPDFHIEPFADQYLRVKFGSYGTRSVRSRRGSATLVKAPENQTLNDTETIIYGASRLKSLGDLSGKYAGTIDVSKAVRLEELIVGSNAAGYQNTNLKTLAIGNNKMLRWLNVMNCPNLRQAIDVSGCENIEEIYAEGTGATGIVLPTGGYLRILHLPNTIRSLTIRNQTKLTNAGFSIAGVTLLTTLVLENTRIDTFDLLARCFSQSIYALERVRLIDVVGSTESTTLLARLAHMGGVDENGNDISNAIVTGVCTVVGVYRDDYQILQKTFPELTINYTYMWIKFADPVAQSICASLWDTNSDGEITEEEAGIERIIDNTTFAGNEQLTSFDEFRYFSCWASSHSLFMGCTALKRISFPVIRINGGKLIIIYRTCSGCTSLEHAGIPEGITKIEEEVFFQCSLLNDVILPESLTAINMNVFNGCSSLSTITIPARVTDIMAGAFNGCIAMKSMILLPEVPPLIGYKTFYENNTLFYVPDHLADTYKTASGWTPFAARIHPLSELNTPTA